MSTGTKSKTPPPCSFLTIIWAQPGPGCGVGQIQIRVGGKQWAYTLK